METKTLQVHVFMYVRVADPFGRLKESPLFETICVFMSPKMYECHRPRELVRILFETADRDKSGYLDQVT